MTAARRLVRLLVRVAADEWQCEMCSGWFSGPASQRCPGCR